MAGRVACTHWRDACTNALALPLYGATPSAGICRQCEHYDGPDRGLGDTIHRVAKATGVATVVKRVTGGDCGCQRRRASLNDSVPFTNEAQAPLDA